MNDSVGLQIDLTIRSIPEFYRELSFLKNIGVLEKFNGGTRAWERYRWEYHQHEGRVEAYS